jgi:hypothetical protein
VLNLMRKGISPLQNVQVLKWCSEYGVHPMWNVLYGFPGESAADYEEMCEIVQKLSHLVPPVYCVPMCVERFSPYFNSPADFGISNLRSNPLYRFVYPFDESILYNIAYSFEGDFEGQDRIDSHSERIKVLVDGWKKEHIQSTLQVKSRTADSMVVQDERPTRIHPLYYFGAREMAVIDSCNRIQSLPQIVKQTRQTLNGAMPSEAWIAGFVHYLTECGLVLKHNEKYLNLILSPQREASRSSVYVA